VARRWTSADDACLRRSYTSGEPIAEIARALGRSTDAVVARRALLGIAPRRVPRPWSERGDRLLRSAVETGVPATALAGRLQRSVHQIRARTRQLGLAMRTARGYTPAEDSLLRDLWTGGDGVADLAHRLGRSPDAVRLRARALGLHRPAVRRRWTAVEDATLRDGYADGLTCRRIADSLAERTPAAVAARARKLGLTTYARAWTAQDDSRLRRLAPLRSPAEIAQLLGRTPEAVRRRARTLGLTSGAKPRPPRAGARWSAEEDALLRLHAGMNPGALALRLGRSDLGVAARVRQLGLRDGRHRSPHHPAPTDGGLTAGEWRLIDRELARATGRGLQALSHRLERSPAAIRELADQRARDSRSPAPKRVASSG
jgi:hypothetical protein